MNIEVPVRNEDGSMKFTAVLDAAQVQVILQFGLNFLLATGLSAAYGINLPEQEGKQLDLQFDD